MQPAPFPLRARAALLIAALALAACAQLNVAGSGDAAQPAPAPAPAPAVPPPAAAAAPATLAPPPEPAALQVTRAALIVPLSGSAAAAGRDLLDAAQMALFDFAVPRFELRIYDSGGTGLSARAAAERARADGVELVLGPLLSEAVTGAADVMRPAGIPVFAFSNDRLVAGGGVYAAGFSPEAQIDRVVAFAARRGMIRYAALVPDDGFGARIAGAFETAVARNGGSVVDRAFYTGDPDALTETVRVLARYAERAKALEEEKKALAAREDSFSKRALARLETRDTLGEVGFEALMLPAGGAEVLQVAPLLAFYDIDPVEVKLLGTWVWDDPALGKEPTMVGAWFAAPPPAARRRFVERFRAAYDRVPDRLATLAYDGVALAAVLARGVEPGDGPYAEARLLNPDGFAGVDGIFRLDARGLVQRGLSVLEVRRDAPAEIDPAPTSFAVPAN
jgi:branched-chain amino acid transport system substrate-binding protein